MNDVGHFLSAFNRFFFLNNIEQSRPPQTIQSRLLIEWNAKSSLPPRWCCSRCLPIQQLDGLRPYPKKREKPHKKLMEFGNPFKKPEDS